VDVLLQNTIGEPDLTLNEMRVELNSLMAHAGYEIRWHSPQASAEVVPGDLVVVQLRGSCKPPSDPIREPVRLRLGSSEVADGRVLPFSWVDCSAVARVLEPYLSRDQKDQRELVYGRAIARVLAHELYHVLGHTQVHTKNGLTKAHFEPSDLLDDGTMLGRASTLRLQVRAASHQPR